MLCATITTLLAAGTQERAVVYVCTAGSGRITVPELEEEWRLVPGETLLLPAAVGGHRVETDRDQLTVLRVDTQDGT